MNKTRLTMTVLANTTKIRPLLLLLLVLTIISGCTGTSVRDQWVEPGLAKTYHKPLIIGRSDSQQTRRIYEDYLAGEFKKIGVTAVPSYTLISSKEKINEETVVNAVKRSGIGIDSVLVTYLVASETELVSHDSPLSSSYSGSYEDNTMSSTLITNRRYSGKQIITLKNDLYDAGSRKIVWSAVTESVGPDSIDEVIVDVSELLVKALKEDHVF